MDAGTYNQTIEVLFKNELLAALDHRVQEILLFGSRARGDAKDDSDYDFLVVVDSVDRVILDTIDRVAGEILVEHGKLVSAFPLTPKERQLRYLSPLMQNIAREGVVM